jgi:hypothetical protein
MKNEKRGMQSEKCEAAGEALAPVVAHFSFAVLRFAFARPRSNRTLCQRADARQRPGVVDLARAVFFFERAPERDPFKGC